MATAIQRAAKRKEFLQGLFASFLYCPMCGAELKKFGNDTEMKKCPKDHGIAYILGKRQGQKVGLFLEVFEE